jgi:hypothetical protein
MAKGHCQSPPAVTCSRVTGQTNPAVATADSPRADARRTPASAGRSRTGHNRSQASLGPRGSRHPVRRTDHRYQGLTGSSPALVNRHGRPPRSPEKIVCAGSNPVGGTLVGVGGGVRRAVISSGVEGGGGGRGLRSDSCPAPGRTAGAPDRRETQWWPPGRDGPGVVSCLVCGLRRRCWPRFRLGGGC